MPPVLTAPSSADVRKRRRGEARDRPLPPLLARVGGNIEVRPLPAADRWCSLGVLLDVALKEPLIVDQRRTCPLIGYGTAAVTAVWCRRLSRAAHQTAGPGIPVSGPGRPAGRPVRRPADEPEAGCKGGLRHGMVTTYITTTSNRHRGALFDPGWYEAWRV